MFDETGQIEYWRATAESDIETAEILFDKNKFRECLFFCHLCIEKILKAHYVKVQKILAPKTHHLQYLAEKSNIVLDDKLYNLFGILMTYQLEGRYPESYPTIPRKELANDYFLQTKDTLICLMQKL